MVTRLASLVSVTGRPRRRLDVELPGEPDAAARRDGISDSVGRAGGQRAAWLSQIVGATPLSFWEDRLALAPNDVVRLAKNHADVLRGLEHAATRQHDARFAIALFDLRPRASLLAAVPSPWTAELSRSVIDRMRAHEPNAFWLAAIVEVAATRLDVSVTPLVESWLGQLGDDDARRRDLRRLLHALTLRRTIAEELQ
jgi:hypothetical protein